MTPITPSPPSNMEVETLCFWGVFQLRGQLHRIKGMMDGAIYCQGQGIEASQCIENRGRVLQHDNDTKHTA